MAGELVGVVGADLTMQELFADIAYFRVAGHTAYVFIIDLTGRVLMHPYMPAPGSVDEDPVVTNIDAFERNDKVRRFLQRTLASIKLKLGNNGSGTDDVYTSLFQSLRVLPAVRKKACLFCVLLSNLFPVCSGANRRPSDVVPLFEVQIVLRGCLQTE